MNARPMSASPDTLTATETRAARLTVRRAIAALAARDFPGEAARARVMAARWERFAGELIRDNRPRLANVRTVRVVWSLSRLIRRAILTAEVGEHGARRAAP